MSPDNFSVVQDNIPLRPDQRNLINCVGNIAPANSIAYSGQLKAQEQANRQGHRISEWEVTIEGIYVGMCDMCSLVCFAVPRGAIFGTALTFYCDVQRHIEKSEQQDNIEAKRFHPTNRPYCEQCGNGTTLVGRECKHCTNIVPRAYNIIPSQAPAYGLLIETTEERQATIEHYIAHKVKVYEQGHRTTRYMLPIVSRHTIAVQRYKYTGTATGNFICHNGHKATAAHHYIMQGYKPKLHGYNPKRAIQYNCSALCKQEVIITDD